MKSTMTDELENRRKRLLFRAHHMGMNENDLIFGQFAEAFVADFTADQLDRFEALIAENDADLFDWVSGKAPVPARVDHDVMRLLLRFKLVSVGA